MGDEILADFFDWSQKGRFYPTPFPEKMESIGASLLTESVGTVPTAVT